MDADFELRLELAQENIDFGQLQPDVRDWLRALWAVADCRQTLRGQWTILVSGKIDWVALGQTMDEMEKSGRDGTMAGVEMLESLGLESSAAQLVADCANNRKKLSRMTLFMRALGEFPRHLYHGAALSADLAPWMPEELAAAARSTRAALTKHWNASWHKPPLQPCSNFENNIVPHDLTSDVLGDIVWPLVRKLESVWPADPNELERFGGPQLPFWLSPFRRAELQRQLALCAFYERDPAGAKRNGRSWLGNRGCGKTQLQRMAALLIALLQPSALVAYCSYDQYDFCPLELLSLLHPPKTILPQPGTMFGYWRSHDFIFYFADELQHLFFRKNTAALHQLNLFGYSEYNVTFLCGSDARMPVFICSEGRPPEFANLPPLNERRHPLESLPAVTSLVEARDLAETIAPTLKLDDSVLRELCWRGTGSLAYLIPALKQLAKVNVSQRADGSATAGLTLVDALPPLPTLPEDPFDPLCLVVSLFWSEMRRYKPKRDPFTQALLTEDTIVRMLWRVITSKQHQQAASVAAAGGPIVPLPPRREIKPGSAEEQAYSLFDSVYNAGLLSGGSGYYRLAHPQMMEQYESTVSRQHGLTMPQLHNLLPSLLRDTKSEERDILSAIAYRCGATLVPVRDVSALQTDAQARQHRGDTGPCLYVCEDSNNAGGTRAGGVPTSCDPIAVAQLTLAVEWLFNRHGGGAEVGVFVAFDAQGGVTDLAFHYVRIALRPEQQLDLAQLKLATAKHIKVVTAALGASGRAQCHMWYLGYNHSPPTALLLRRLRSKLRATVHWHGPLEVFRALPPAKQAFMHWVQTNGLDRYPVPLPPHP